MPAHPTHPESPGTMSFATLGLKLAAALCRAWWRRAVRVLSTGDCHVH